MLLPVFRLRSFLFIPFFLPSLFCKSRRQPTGDAEPAKNREFTQQGRSASINLWDPSFPALPPSLFPLNARCPRPSSPFVSRAALPYAPGSVAERESRAAKAAFLNNSGALSRHPTLPPTSEHVMSLRMRFGGEFLRRRNRFSSPSPFPSPFSFSS